jgi:hypothetical protein
MRDRYDRHVRRATLCLDRGAPRHRFAFTMEEALRLASVPGEDEGRSYYFRSLRIVGLPASGDRRIWLECFQRALRERAVEAIHGADARAASASTVFFRGEQEALEILLRRLVAGRPAPEWFWPLIMAGPSGAQSTPSSSIGPVPIVIEKLRAGPASWLAVSAALFATPGFDVVSLLEAIPPATAEDWLEEIAGPKRLPALGPTRIYGAAVRPVQEALRAFGSHDAGTLWLATLAILADAPGELTSGTAVARARTVLQSLQTALPPESLIAATDSRTALPPVASSPDAARPPDAAASDATTAAPEVSRPLETELAPTDVSPSPEPSAERDYIVSEASWTTSADADLLSPTTTARTPSSTATPVPPATPPVSVPSTPPPSLESQPDSIFEPASDSETPSLRWYCAGLETAAGGFFFLLNALQRLGISQALGAGLAPAGPDFLPRLLRRLAAHAGVAPDDPAMQWLDTLPFSAPDPPDSFPCDDSSWPINLRPSRDAAHIDYIVRVWYLAVRRWCWHATRMTLRDSVTRPGLFSVNGTDLDVSLPLDQADVRIRKAGLDLDPGWLPWFGRVVRFHYLYPGEFHG